jgi:hypothetical protein
MKYLPCYFAKGQLTKVFFCFPDPHFKVANHRRRIVTTELLAEYAYALAEGEGILYTISDVLDLHNWMAAHAEAHPCFARIPDAALAGDPCVPVMRTYTEEGQKVERNHGSKYVAVFRRLTAAQADAKAAATSADFWATPHVDYTYIPAASQQMNAAAREATGGVSKRAAKRARRDAAAAAAVADGGSAEAGGTGADAAAAAAADN